MNTKAPEAGGIWKSMCIKVTSFESLNFEAARTIRK